MAGHICHGSEFLSGGVRRVWDSPHPFQPTIPFFSFHPAMNKGITFGMPLGGGSRPWAFWGGSLLYDLCTADARHNSSPFLFILFCLNCAFVEHDSSNVSKRQVTKHRYRNNNSHKKGRETEWFNTRRGRTIRARAMRRSRWRRKTKNNKKKNGDNDVENEEDQWGKKKVTVNYLSTLHPPTKQLI